MKKKAMLSNRLFKAMVFMMPFLALFGCNKDESPAGNLKPEKDVYTFEREFSESINYGSDKTLKLIGYKKLKIEQQDLAGVKAFLKQHQDKMKNYYFDKANSTLRIYFPVEAALVEQDNVLTEANLLGELSLPNEENANLELAVVGRKQTDAIRGVEGNIIKDGVIYLAEKTKADHHIGNIYVFDFGYKMIMDHNDHSTGTGVMAKASCMSNHGGPSCSDAFGIHKGRCTFNRRVCMDYNGWFTNCVNGKWSNFPGSDCDYALGAGHCWNEVM